MLSFTLTELRSLSDKLDTACPPLDTSKEGVSLFAGFCEELRDKILSGNFTAKDVEVASILTTPGFLSIDSDLVLSAVARSKRIAIVQNEDRDDVFADGSWDARNGMLKLLTDVTPVVKSSEVDFI